MSDSTSDDSRARIAQAALATFAEYGFEAASTREIARRAGVNQGLITYYFKSKEALWREVANTVFGEFAEILGNTQAAAKTMPPREASRLLIREFALFLGRRPNLVRFMIGDGKRPAERVDWLVDTHLKGFYQGVPLFSEEPERRAHQFYALVGAAALMFAIPDECVRLTGIDPNTEHSIELHADLLTELFAG